MKKVNIIKKLLLAIMLLPTIAACDKDNGGNDAIAISPFDFMIKSNYQKFHKKVDFPREIHLFTLY